VVRVNLSEQRRVNSGERQSVFLSRRPFELFVVLAAPCTLRFRIDLFASTLPGFPPLFGTHRIRFFESLRRMAILLRLDFFELLQAGVKLSLKFLVRLGVLGVRLGVLGDHVQQVINP
jgi:hypothetical protein